MIIFNGFLIIMGLISITWITALIYVYFLDLLESSSYSNYRKTKQERKRREYEEEQKLKKLKYEEELKIKRKEYKKEQERIREQKAFLNRTTYKNPEVYQTVEEINSTKNDCPNCGRSDGRHDPKCYI